MIPTVEQACTLARDLLRDVEISGGEEYTNDRLRQAFGVAYRELYAEMQRNSLPFVESTIYTTLAATIKVLTPATAGITDFGELVRMRERLQGSTDQFVAVEGPLDVLPQRDPAVSLQVFDWANDTWSFVGATTNRELEITYRRSGNAPTTGSVGVDDSLNFLGYRMAAHFSPAFRADAQNYLDTLIQIMVRNQPSRRPKAFRLRRYLQG